jgi:hypothetical protein
MGNEAYNQKKQPTITKQIRFEIVWIFELSPPYFGNPSLKNSMPLVNQIHFFEGKSFIKKHLFIDNQQFIIKFNYPCLNTITTINLKQI